MRFLIYVLTNINEQLFHFQSKKNYLGRNVTNIDAYIFFAKKYESLANQLAGYLSLKVCCVDLYTIVS